MKKNQINNIIETLKITYPEAHCSLNYTNEFELLIATRLSAQCTDKRVNIVTPILFEKYKTLEDFADADINELEEIVRPCGFYKVKAQNIKDMCKMLIDVFDKKMPDTIEDLTRLPGIGRKTANLIMGDFHKKPAIVADTHVIRITNLLGLVSTKDPHKVEQKLKEILPQKEQLDFCHRLVHHGRALCIARRPKCEICPLSKYCNYYKTKTS